MTSRRNKLVFVLALGLATAQVSFAQNAAGEATSPWERFKVAVKVKVKEWVDYWKGVPPAPQTAPATGVAKTTGGSETAKAPAVTTAERTPQVGTGTTGGVVASPPTGLNPSRQAAPVKPSPPVLNQENEALRKQKLFQSDGEKGSSLKRIQAIRDSVKAKPVLKVSQPGRAGTSKLAKSKQGVPLADFRKLRVSKVVPALDIGRESLISREEFATGDISFSIGRPGELKKLHSPGEVPAKEFKSAAAIQPAKTYGPRLLQANMRTVGKLISREDIEKIQYSILAANDVKLLPYKPLSEDELKMLAALILFEKGNHCHMIMGLFHQLAEAPKTRIEANYHLGACADSLKMEQVAFDRLSQVVASEDKEFASPALELLAKDLPLIYERDFFGLIKKLKGLKNIVTESAQDNVAYRTAKGAYRAGDYKTSLTYATRVNSGTEFSDDARFLSAMNSFALNDRAAALKKLQELSGSLEARKVQDKNIRALTAVNLARMHFAQKDYGKALEHYMQVPKDHALWVQALIEQGWTQIALDDFSGAIGNMYSLHSPYFRAVYQPESFVVRSIGYLNICQYGDAYRTLTELEKEYRDAGNRLGGYMQSRLEPATVYGTVKSYIKGKSTENVDGVPYQLWREMARRKDFLNLQTALNDKQDEATRYNGVNQKIKEEKAGIRWRAEQAKKRFDQWKVQLAKVAGDKALAKNRDEWENNLKRERDLTIAYRFQLAILEQSRQGFQAFQSKAQGKLDSETAALGTKAGESLVRHAKNIKEELARVLDNNEFLRYEVFAGSGENIRYQVSGGKVGVENRVPANIKPTKMMNWNFDGEFWEDEIGSYRSSLQNVCPSNISHTAKTGDDEN